VFNVSFENVTGVMSFLGGSPEHPVMSCVNVSGVMEWCNEAIQSEVVGAARYIDLLHVGLFAAFVGMVVIDWIGRNNLKKAQQRIKDLEIIAGEKRDSRGLAEEEKGGGQSE
jgi:hypothetical protein